MIRVSKVEEVIIIYAKQYILKFGQILLAVKHSNFQLFVWHLVHIYWMFQVSSFEHHPIAASSTTSYSHELKVSRCQHLILRLGDLLFYIRDSPDQRCSHCKLEAVPVSYTQSTACQLYCDAQNMWYVSRLTSLDFQLVIVISIRIA